MFGGNNTPSLADIAAVTDNNRNDGMMGMNGGWWVLIILLALFGGFGNGGWGNNRNNSCDNGGTTIVTVPTGGFGGGWGAFDAASMQRGFDNSGVISKLDGLNSGLCSLGYDQLDQMNRIGMTVQQTGWGLSQQMQQLAIADMQDTNALSRQLSDCCCENRQGQMQIINAMDKNACQTNWNMAQLGRDIMDNDNANFRQLDATIRDGFQSIREQGYIQEIQGLRQALNDCNAANLAQATARQVVQEIRPCPIPSYDVPNPYCCYGDGYNRGCGGCNR